MILGLQWDWKICDNVMAGEITVEQSYTYLIMVHFDYNGSGYLCKHDRQNTIFAQMVGIRGFFLC